MNKANMHVSVVWRSNL